MSAVTSLHLLLLKASLGSRDAQRLFFKVVSQNTPSFAVMAFSTEIYIHTHTCLYIFIYKYTQPWRKKILNHFFA